MDVFELHRSLISDYSGYVRSFLRISDERILSRVKEEMEQGLLWPDPLIQLNPSFGPGDTVDKLVDEGLLHEECSRIFRIKENKNDLGRPFRLHRHQSEAIRIARSGRPYVLTTGTGSGKSLTYIVPAVDHVLRRGTGNGIQAIIVYPMNALANSQREELEKFLSYGYEEGSSPVSFARYTGQEREQEREQILKNPPDILLTNYVMLELILTRVDERELVQGARDLRFLVLDELHTYRGRQGADVAMLVRRCREAMSGDQILCVGTSATMGAGEEGRSQQEVVADVASTIFGQTVEPEDVVGETLRRDTPELHLEDPEEVARLSAAAAEAPPVGHGALSVSPVSSWLESTFGLSEEPDTGRLLRQTTPRSIEGAGGAAEELASLTNLETEKAARTIRDFLLAGASERAKDPESGRPLFAFRLHQFITRGDTVWASLEGEEERALTLRGQRFVPGDRDRFLFPLVFCRSCGQAYYRVRRHKNDATTPVEPLERFGKSDDDEISHGYLYLSSEDPWPVDPEEVVERVPPDWTESGPQGQRRVRSARRKWLPEATHGTPGGVLGSEGVPVAWMEAPFRFCLNRSCGVAFSGRQRSDAGKLGTLGQDGRSTATSILALRTILTLRSDEDSRLRKANKLLSFTDNRQDAALQAGHFNDFVEVSLLRSALYRAMLRVAPEPLVYDDLTQDVERSMDLPADLYANDPEIRGPGLAETRRALRSVIGHYLYRDLERGWRLTSPNLEQCGLLVVDYLGLDELVAEEEYWQEKSAHPLLLEASPDQKHRIVRVLLDHLRRTLCIKHDSLDANRQDSVCERSRQRLRDPWVIEDSDDMVKASVAWPRSGLAKESAAQNMFVSAQSNFGLFLKRPGVLVEEGTTLSMSDTLEVIESLFACLKGYGMVEEVRSARDDTKVPGYQLPASILLWRADDGSEPMVDELRVTQATESQIQGNRYFIDLYKTFAEVGPGLEAREHTAQVPADQRQEREIRFRSADLPILFCSPTMELGVDIAQLNVVGLRNVPPTPANYAQRSGRAGRSGQPALVFTYCSGFSPHDQYYFRSPAEMVAGSVRAPQIDLHNQDLVASHVHAVWLSEARLNLGRTLAEILEVSEDELSLPLRSHVEETLQSAPIRGKALGRARQVLASIPGIEEASWYREDWLEDVIGRVPQTFDHSCDRWRTLYRSAVDQRTTQNRIIGDHSRPQSDRKMAKRLRAQAETQIQLLTEAKGAFEGDFYSYRYFASEGFLPGYNFPRLPISAYIPARRGRRGQDEFLSRPRFLAISEFGPRAVIYHEGSHYRINKVSLAFDLDSRELTRGAMKICGSCGYGHLIETPPGPDVCEHCATALPATGEIRDLVRLQNVSTKRMQRITSDEEERQRIGYEVQTAFRFAEVNNDPQIQRAHFSAKGTRIGTLDYGDAATIWRINRGWRQRRAGAKPGFALDVERGYWASNKKLDDTDKDDPLSTKLERVVPYVDDRRNVLTLTLEMARSEIEMASLQASLKEAILRMFQLEPGEISVEPLPSRDDRQVLLFYEAAEGGAGVLRQVVADSQILPTLAKRAIEICHSDPATGEDLGADAGGGTGCEAACYDCLLDYTNQPDHGLLDRKAVLKTLLEIAGSDVETSTGAKTREELYEDLVKRCDSGLEREWLHEAYASGLRLPSHAQYKVPNVYSRPDFFYAATKAVIFVDGPPHDETRESDEEVTDLLSDRGYLVIRFHHRDDWGSIFSSYPDIFGTAQ